MIIGEIERAAGIKTKDARHFGKITPADLRYIMLKVAEQILLPGAFTNEGMSWDAHGKSHDVFEPGSCQCDLYGWIIKFSYAHWASMRAGRRTIGQVVSMYIDSHIRNVTDDEFRLMDLGDIAVRDGVKAASRLLVDASKKLHPVELPLLFPYAKDYEDEDDRTKRIAKEILRRGERALKEPDDRVPADIVAEVSENIESLKTVRKGKDFNAIKLASKTLELSLAKWGQVIADAEEAAREATKNDGLEKEAADPVHDTSGELVS